MKKLLLTAFLVYSCHLGMFAQTFTDSNLPIVLINTDGGLDIGDSDILGNMKVIYRGTGQRNYVTDQDSLQYLNYDGRISIKIRGSSTEILQKKQYKVSTIKADNVTNNNVVLLGMPSDNDWIFNAMGFDPALIRDYLCYNLSRQIGEYASRTVYCELIVNNVFKGLFVLQEKIKQGKNRVNIMKMAATDNNLPNLSGGYIVKADHSSDPVILTMPSYVTSEPVFYYNEYPKPGTATAQQDVYIDTVLQQLARAAHVGNVSLETGYPSVIDIPSFVDYMIISELSSNSDSYQYSTYFHKDRNGKLRAGPVWDNDLTFGNDLFFWGLDRSHTDVWQFGNGDNEGSEFWFDLFNSKEFRCCLYKRWMELTQPGAPLNYLSISNFIDKTIAWISEAAARNRALWFTVDQQYNTDLTDDYSTDIAKIKSFVQTRISWINSYLQSSTSGCPVPTLPPLVITKINYSPKATIDFPSSNDLQFIEITNTGNSTVNLTGDYFKGTGFGYQFPAYSEIFPRSSIMLSSNPAVFMTKYGFSPFGQFTRNLDNTGEPLILADGFGNVIDSVFYSNQSPWPDADANGYYLTLIDPLSDNSVGTNWTATEDVITSVGKVENNQNVIIYPTPVKNSLTVESSVNINRLLLFDFQGSLLQTININEGKYSLEMSSYSSGLYIIEVITSEGTIVRRIIKE
jgi:CotH kinase protein/Lamin Tail Domain/Secretion system C-terminal sorting domain